MHHDHYAARSATDAGRLDVGNSLIAQDWNELTFRVHREAYRSAEVFQAERERIWGHNWLYLGHETEIPKPTTTRSGRSAASR